MTSATAMSNDRMARLLISLIFFINNPRMSNINAEQKIKISGIMCKIFSIKLI
jgi:hypothetical protein|tara:strand:+ start:216 stop:374 length:159 start_codon:yes stop_codon:yes gene_type:complete